MAISFSCPQCAVRHQVKDEMAGTKARCKCGATLAIPSRPAPAAASPATSGGSSTIPVRCSGCGRQHQASAALAGKAAKCSCGAVLQIPAPNTVAGGADSIFDELSAEELNPTPFAQPSTGSRAASSPGDGDVLRQYAGVSAGHAGGARAGCCPSCGSRSSNKVSWTWRGGILGPRIFNHVRCNQCGTAYNGKTGNYNTTAIGVYLGVSFALGFGVLTLIALAGFFGAR